MTTRLPRSPRAIVLAMLVWQCGYGVSVCHAADARSAAASVVQSESGAKARETRVPDFAKMHRVGPEGTVFRLSKPVRGYYVAMPPDGGPPKWLEGDLPAGLHSATNGLWGDPLNGVVKTLYIADASALLAMPGPLAEPPPPPAGFVATRAMLEPLKLNAGWPRDKVSDAVLAALTTRERPLTSGEMTTDEFGTGYRPEIGAVAYASQVYLTTLDPRARLHMLAEADLSKASFPIHRNLAGRASPTPPEPWLYGDRTDLIDDPLQVSGIRVDIAHAPQFLTVPAFLMGLEHNETKFREYLDELRWWVSTVHFGMQPNYRQGSKGIFNSYMGQVRATAWAFRNVDDLLMLHEQMASFGFRMTDLDTAWMKWLAQCVDANIRFNDGVFRTGDYPTDIPQGRPGSFEPYAGRPKGVYRNELGFTNGGTSAYGGGPDGKDVVQGMWQQGFQTHMLIRSYRRNHASLSPETRAIQKALALWLARFPIGLCGAEGDTAGFDIRYADLYTTVIARTAADGRPVFPADFAALFALQRFPPLPPPDHTMRHNGDVHSVSYYTGSFFDDVFPALTEAVEIGAPGAVEAYAHLEGIRQFHDPGPDLAFAWTPKGKTLGARGAAVPKATGLPPAPTATVPRSPSVATDPAQGHR